MKDEFLATVSHELRTPLTCSVPPSAHRRRRAQRPPREDADARHRHRQRRRPRPPGFNDILDLERIGSGKAEPQQSRLLRRRSLHRAAGLQQDATRQGRFPASSTTNNVTAWADPDPSRRHSPTSFNAIKFYRRGSEIHAFAVCTLDDNEARSASTIRPVSSRITGNRPRALPAGLMHPTSRHSGTGVWPRHLPRYRRSARRPHLGHQRVR